MSDPFGLEPDPEVETGTQYIKFNSITGQIKVIKADF